MDLFLGILTDLGQWLRPYTRDIALALVASLLVITGNDINRFVKKQISSAHFLFRTLVFITVCTFGYGALTVLLTSILASQLSGLSALNLAVVIFVAFLGLGVLAERKNQI